MALLLPPSPPVPRTAQQQATAFSNASFWSSWYEQLRAIVNSIASGFAWSYITGTPTTLAGYGITDAEQIINKDAVSGYAGLNTSSRITKGVDTTDDIITDDADKGPVMKSPDGHYWRAAISDAGAVTWTNLGTTKP
jgi:hypothetical protein